MNTVIISPFAYRLLTFMILLFIPLSLVSPHGVVWEVIIGGLIGLYYSRKQQLAKLPHTLLLVLLSFPLWGFVTSLWSPYPKISLLMSLKVLSLVVLGLYWCRLTLSLSRKTQESLFNALIGGLIFSLFFLLIEAWSGNAWLYYWNKSSAKGFAQGSLIISLATWPAFLWILRQPYSLFVRIILSICLLFLIFWALFQIDCDTSYIGLFFGLCVFGGTFMFPRISSWGMRLFLPVFIISFPFISLYMFKPENIPTLNTYIHSASYLDRIHIWNDVATTIFEHPWQGIGMDGTPHHEKRDIMRHWSYIDEQGVVTKAQSTRFAIHPHNAILQLWLELGFVGVILGVLLVHLTLFQIYRTHLVPIEKAVGAGLFTGIFLIVWVNLGFWQNWWISGLWIIIGLTITLFKSKREADERVCS